jgi:hypothetical protein
VLASGGRRIAEAYKDLKTGAGAQIATGYGANKITKLETIYQSVIRKATVMKLKLALITEI